MPVDPEISLRAGQPTGGAGAAGGLGSTVGMLDTFAQLQNRLNQNRLFQQEFEAKQGIGQIFATSGSLEEGMDRASRSPFAAYAAPAVNTYRQSLETAVRTEGERAKQGDTALENFTRSLAPLAANPSQEMWDSLVQRNLATVPPGVADRVKKGYDAIGTSLFAGVPKGSAEIDRMDKFHSNLAGVLLGGGMTPDAIRSLSGVPAPSISVGPFGPGGSQAPFYTGGQLLGKPTAQVIGGGGAAGGGGNALGGTAPTAGGGGGFGGALSPGQEAFQKESNLAASNYKTDLDSLVAGGSSIMKTLTEAREALKDIKPGGLASTYVKLAGIAQGLGVDPKIVDQIAGGNYGAAQEFQKLMVNTTMSQMSQQTQGHPGAIRSYMEFKTFNENNPRLDTDPRAIERIYNFWTRIHQTNREEQKAYMEDMKKKGDPVTWPARWQDMAEKRGLIQPVVTQPKRSLEQILGPALSPAPAQ